jgi:hypothetical protein
MTVSLHGAGKYGVATGQTAEASCTACGAGKYGVATGQTAEASCTDCGAGKYRVETGGSAKASCTVCGVGKYGFAAGQTAEVSCKVYTYVDPSDPLFLGAPNVTYSGDTNVTVAFETKSNFESYRLVVYEPGWFNWFTWAFGRDHTLSTPLVVSPKVLTPDDYTSFTLQVASDGVTEYGPPLNKEYFQKHVFRARMIGMKPDGGGVVSCKTGVKRMYENGTAEITTTCSPDVGITCICVLETGSEGNFLSDGQVVSDPFQTFVNALAPSAVGICDILDQTAGSPCDASRWGTQQVESGNLCRRSIVAPVVNAEHVCGCLLVLPFDVFYMLTF